MGWVPRAGLAGLGSVVRAVRTGWSDLGKLGPMKGREGRKKGHPFSKGGVSLETRVLLGTRPQGKERSVQEPLTGTSLVVKRS